MSLLTTWETIVYRVTGEGKENHQNPGVQTPRDELTASAGVVGQLVDAVEEIAEEIVERLV